MTSTTIPSEGGACIVVTPVGDGGRVNIVAKGYANVNATFDRTRAIQLAWAILDATGGRFEVRALSFEPVDAAAWTGEQPQAGPIDLGNIRGVYGFVEAFQKIMGLPATGTVGEATIAALSRVTPYGVPADAIDRIVAAVRDAGTAHGALNRMRHERDAAEEARKATCEERDAARKQRDDYKRRLDAFEREPQSGRGSCRIHVPLGAEWVEFPRGRWTVRGFSVTHDGGWLDLVAYAEPANGD